ncbi:hypothetical protein [Bartonella raoultii]|uniref:hypothetical protein n=1 Tax=Bartonella raoultii TaxID=1457020 RepID=UPI001ABB4C1B|nr:hypothetical protein [Bartonella raoultii]
MPEKRNKELSHENDQSNIKNILNLKNHIIGTDNILGEIVNYTKYAIGKKRASDDIMPIEYFAKLFYLG